MPPTLYSATRAALFMSWTQTAWCQMLCSWSYVFMTQTPGFKSIINQLKNCCESSFYSISIGRAHDWLLLVLHLGFPLNDSLKTVLCMDMCICPSFPLWTCVSIHIYPSFPRYGRVYPSIFSSVWTCVAIQLSVWSDMSSWLYLTSTALTTDLFLHAQYFFAFIQIENHPFTPRSAVICFAVFSFVAWLFVLCISSPWSYAWLLMRLICLIYNIHHSMQVCQ